MGLLGVEAGAARARVRMRERAQERAPSRLAWLRRAALVVIVAGTFAGIPSGAAATVTGGCTVIGTSTSGGTIDLTTTSVWHVRSSDEIWVTGSAPFDQTDGSASAYAFGFAIPLTGGHSEAKRAAQSDTFSVSTLALLGRVFVIGGGSSGPFHDCSGQVEIVIDDANPLLTIAGGGGLGLALVGLLGAVWALRRPASAWRRLVGLVALAMIGAGASLVLQQASTPGEVGGLLGAAGAGPSAFVASVASPGQVSLDPAVLVQSALLSALIVVLMPFPSELFNSTLQANLAEVRGWLARIPLLSLIVRPRPARGGELAGAEEPAAAGWYHPVAIAAFVAVSALLYGLLDPGFGPDGASLLTYAGILAAIIVVGWLAGLPRRAIQRAATGDRGRVRAVPWTLLVAAGCVLVSRLTGFLPGYLYGLVFGYAFVRVLDEKREGPAQAAGAWWMLGLAAVAWFALGAVRSPGIEPSVPALLAQSVLAATVVAGVEGIVFGFLPLRFLAGHDVLRWSRPRWAILYGLGLFGFLWVILNPSNGFVSATPQSSLVTTIALLVAFAVVSVLFWGYFRFRRPRVST